jgi:hypothetical protein
MTLPGIGLHRSGAVPTGDLSLAAYVHLGPVCSVGKAYLVAGL